MDSQRETPTSPFGGLLGSEKTSRQTRTYTERQVDRRELFRVYIPATALPNPLRLLWNHSKPAAGSRRLEPLDLGLELLDALFEFLELLASLLHPLAALLHPPLDHLAHLRRHVGPRRTAFAPHTASTVIAVFTMFMMLTTFTTPVGAAVTAWAMLSTAVMRRPRRAHPLGAHPVDDAVELFNDPIESAGGIA